MATMEPPRAAPFDPGRVPPAAVFADLETLHAELTAVFGRLAAVRTAGADVEAAHAAVGALFARLAALRGEADRLEARLAALRRQCRVAMAGGQEPPRALDLAARREALGLSQRQLAAACGYSRTMVSEVEKGRRTGWDARAALDRALTRLEVGRVGGVA